MERPDRLHAQGGAPGRGRRQDHGEAPAGPARPRSRQPVLRNHHRRAHAGKGPAPARSRPHGPGRRRPRTATRQEADRRPAVVGSRRQGRDAQGTLGAVRRRRPEAPHRRAGPLPHGAGAAGQKQGTPGVRRADQAHRRRAPGGHRRDRRPAGARGRLRRAGAGLEGPIRPRGPQAHERPGGRPARPGDTGGRRPATPGLGRREARRGDRPVARRRG